MAQRGKRDVFRFAKSYSGATNELLTLLSALGKFCNLLIHIDIDVQKSGRILMDDAFLLAIKEMQQPPVFLEFVLEHRDDLLEFRLDIHSLEVVGFLLMSWA